MQSMLSPLAPSGTKVICDKLRFWIGLCLSIFGLCLPVCVESAETDKTPLVSQTFWLDGSRQMSFEEVRAATFTPLHPGIRQQLSEGVGWVRLKLEKQAAHNAPVLMQIRPPFFSSVTLYTAPDKPGGPWLSREIPADELTKPIALGISKPGELTYVKLQVPWDLRVILSLGSAHDLHLQQRQIDVITTMNISLTLAFFAILLFHSDASLRWFRLAIMLFTVCQGLAVLLLMGYVQDMADLTPAQSNWLLKSLVGLTLCAAGIALALFAKELFPESPWMNWLFIWPVGLLVLLPLVFFDIELFFKISEYIRSPGALLFSLLLIYHAIRYPVQLNGKSAKAFFFILLGLSLVLALKNSTAYFSFTQFPATNFDLGIPTEALLRSLIPLVISLLSYFILDSARRQRLSNLQTSLKDSQSNLDIEQKRLDRQLKFTVMLSHELKNPLMASHMALGNLQRHLEPTGPSRQSADTIKQSLEIIDAIIERCAEVDEYEHSSIPLVQSRFSVDELISSIRVIHHNERIYIVTHRVDGSLILTSDIHYLRVILGNLLANALKYSEPDTLVELHLVLQQGELGKELLLSVSNTQGAAGAPDPDQVFERYYRSEGARQQSGTGQGLWLAQSMAQALGSRIMLKVDNHTVTFGFSLSIP